MYQFSIATLWGRKTKNLWLSASGSTQEIVTGDEFNLRNHSFCDKHSIVEDERDCPTQTLTRPTSEWGVQDQNYQGVHCGKVRVINAWTVNASEIVLFVSDFLQTGKQGRVISRKRKVVLTEDRCGVVEGSDRPPLRRSRAPRSLFTAGTAGEVRPTLVYSIRPTITQSIWRHVHISPTAVHFPNSLKDFPGLSSPSNKAILTATMRLQLDT